MGRGVVSLCVCVWGGWCLLVGRSLCEASPSSFLLTKTLIHRNYTDGLKYTARQGITPIMQSWLKLGPHARVLQEHGRSQDVHHWNIEHIIPVNICSKRTKTLNIISVALVRQMCFVFFLYTTKLNINSLMVWRMDTNISGLEWRQNSYKEVSLLSNEDGSMLFIYCQLHTLCSTAHLLHCVIAYSYSIDRQKWRKSLASRGHGQRRRTTRRK